MSSQITLGKRPRIRIERITGSSSEGRRYNTRSRAAATRVESDKKTIQLIHGHAPVLKNLISYLDFESLLACRLTFKPWLGPVTEAVLSRNDNVLRLYRSTSFITPMSFDNDGHMVVTNNEPTYICFIGKSGRNPRSEHSTAGLNNFVQNKTNAKFVASLFPVFELRGVSLEHPLLVNCSSYLTRLSITLQPQETRLMTERCSHFRFDSLQYMNLCMHYCSQFMLTPDENWNWEFPQLSTLALSGTCDMGTDLAEGHVKVMKILLSNHENIKHIQILEDDCYYGITDDTGKLLLTAIVNSPPFQKEKLQAFNLPFPLTLDHMGLLTPQPGTEACPLKTIDIQLSIPEDVKESPILTVFEHYASSLEKILLLKDNQTKVAVTFPLLPNVKEVHLKAGQKEFRSLNFLKSFPSVEKLHISGRRDVKYDKFGDIGFKSILDEDVSFKESKIKCLRFSCIDEYNFKFLVYLPHLVYVSFSTFNTADTNQCQNLIQTLQHCKGLRVLKLLMSKSSDGKTILTGIPENSSDGSRDADVDDDEQPTIPYIGLLQQVTHLELSDWNCTSSSLSTRVVRVLCHTMRLKVLRLRNFRVPISSLANVRDSGIRVESWGCELESSQDDDTLIKATRRLGNFWTVRDGHARVLRWCEFVSRLQLTTTPADDWWNTV